MVKRKWGLTGSMRQLRRSINYYKQLCKIIENVLGRVYICQGTKSTCLMWSILGAASAILKGLYEKHIKHKGRNIL